MPERQRLDAPYLHGGSGNFCSRLPITWMPMSRAQGGMDAAGCDSGDVCRHERHDRVRRRQRCQATLRGGREGVQPAALRRRVA